MRPKGSDHDLGYDDAPPTTLGLGLEQLELAVHPRKRVPDPERPCVEVDVIPAQREQLPLAEPRRQRRHPQRAKAVLRCSFDEPAGMLRCQRLDLVARHPRRVDQLGHVARDEPPSLRHPERPAEHGVEVLDAPGGEAALEFGVEEPLDITWGEFRQRDAAKAGDEVQPQDVVVAGIGRRADGRPGHLIEPAAEEGAELLALARDGPLLVSGLEQGRQLVGRLLARRGDDEPPKPLAVLIAQVDGAFPAAVLALVDGAFVRAAAAHVRGPLGKSMTCAPRRLRRSR